MRTAQSARPLPHPSPLVPQKQAPRPGGAREEPSPQLAAPAPAPGESTWGSSSRRRWSRRRPPHCGGGPRSRLKLPCFTYLLHRPWPAAEAERRSSRVARGAPPSATQRDRSRLVASNTYMGRGRGDLTGGDAMRGQVERDRVPAGMGLARSGQRGTCSGIPTAIGKWYGHYMAQREGIGRVSGAGHGTAGGWCASAEGSAH